MRQLSLKYLPDFEGEGVYFELTDKLADNFKVIGFDIRYWQSYQSLGQDSGVYIFRPKDGQYDSFPYGQFTGIGVAQGLVQS